MRLTELSHPNIAMLFEGGQEGDRYFLVFEFVQGQPLASLINGRPLHVRRALEFGINLADALAEAHAADLIHGDIRPDTIMITPKDRAKFMNFGLAPFTGGGMGRLNASPPYVSPEEIAGKPADARSDIYSLGAVMFEMLTGRQRARGLVLSGLNPDCRPSSNKSWRGCSPPPSSIVRRARRRSRQNCAASRRFSIRAPKRPKPPRCRTATPVARGAGSGMASSFVAAVGRSSAAWYLLRPGLNAP